MENNRILKVLFGLFMLNFTVFVFARDNVDIDTKVKVVEKLGEPGEKKVLKERPYYEYEFFTNEEYVKMIKPMSKYVISKFLLHEINKDDKFSDELKKYLQNNNIFGVKEISENFEDIIKKIKEITEKRINHIEQSIVGFERLILTDEFRKDYAEYEKGAANSWKQVGGSAKAHKYIEERLLKKQGKKFEELTQTEKENLSEKVNEEALKLSQELQDKFNKEAEKEAEERLSQIDVFDGKYFKEYVEFRREDLKACLEIDEENLKYQNQILKNKLNVDKARRIFNVLVADLKKEQESGSSFDFDIDKEFKKELGGNSIKKQLRLDKNNIDKSTKKNK